MGTNQNKKFYDNFYSNALSQPWANPKHAFHQVNGETQETQHQIILKRQTRKQA